MTFHDGFAAYGEFAGSRYFRRTPCIVVTPGRGAPFAQTEPAEMEPRRAGNGPLGPSVTERVEERD